MTFIERIRDLAKFLPVAILLLGGLLFLRSLPGGVLSVLAVTAPTSTVTVGNSSPTVTNVVLNAGGSIVLTAATTTNVSVNATINDNNGCGDITSGTTTILLYRSGITSSTCLTTTSNLNCYLATLFTASSTCSNGTQNTTTTFAVYYFAQATDGSSSFSTQNWIATVIFKDPSNATGSSDSTGQELLTLTAIDVATSSINYGTLSASSTTGAVNQSATTTNAGNSSTTLQLSAQATLTKGASSIATSSQRYSTSTFTFPGTSTSLTDTPVTVPGFLLTSPTTTTNVQQSTYWGLIVPAGTATGTYNGINLFTALFQA